MVPGANPEWLSDSVASRFPGPYMETMLTPTEIIARLGLQPLPAEGGYFVETYRSSERLLAGLLPHRSHGERSLSTAIYYLLTPDTFSAMHRLPGDELYHFYLGDPVEMLQLREDGLGEKIVLGTDLESGMRPQVLVRGGVWQGSRLVPGGRLALLGTTMAPGFEFADYTPGQREVLLQQYPVFDSLIRALTRE
jgi:uncharacterized protein